LLHACSFLQECVYRHFIETSCIIPFYCCGHYLATAAIYRITA
jgi:hypothetical protein